MIDFHSHILPNMDDGPKSLEESIQLLNILENEDVKTVCLTPHFYPDNESFDEFIFRRNKSFELLNKEYKGPINLLLGAEVRFYRGISNNEEVKKLCLQNTNILLLELPFHEHVTDTILHEVINLSKTQHLQIVLAHIERYDIDDQTIKNLQNAGMLIQANTESFLGYFKGRKAIKRLKKGLIDLIGTDTHDTKYRIPRYMQFKTKAEKQLGKELINKVELRANSLINKQKYSQNS